MRQSSRGVMPQRPSHNNSKKNIFVCLGCVMLCVTFDSSFFMSYFRTFTNKRNQTYYSLTYEASVLSIDYIGENKIQATKYLKKTNVQVVAFFCFGTLPIELLFVAFRVYMNI